MLQFSRKVVFLCVCNICVVIYLLLYLHTYAKTTMHLEKDKSHQVHESFELLIGQMRRFYPHICIIDPHLLWHMTTKAEKDLLNRKGYRAKKSAGHENVISVAIPDQDVDKFLAADEQLIFALEQFRIYVLKSKSKVWMKDAFFRRDGYFTSHLLLVRQNTIIHVVVLYSRGNYLWFDSYKNAESYSKLTARLFSGLTFGYYESTFDMFKLSEYRHSSDGAQSTSVMNPSNIAKFLLQIDSAPFVSCLGSALNQETAQKERNVPTRLPTWVFEKTALSVMKEMDDLTTKSLTQFWLASGTLLGWYRDCGIIPYTHDVDFGAWAKDISDDLVQQFKSSTKIKMLNMLGQVEADLEFWLSYQWLRVDLFFTYEDKSTNSYYVGGHRPDKGYSFRYVFPKFKLCSADFLGQRVLVPCDPASVLTAEYGEDWHKPVSNWHYEDSPKNIKGRRYWNQEEMYRVFNFSMS